MREKGGCRERESHCAGGGGWGGRKRWQKDKEEGAMIGVWKGTVQCLARTHAEGQARCGPVCHCTAAVAGWGLVLPKHAKRWYNLEGDGDHPIDQNHLIIIKQYL
jgi:hypothetical protein